MSSEINKEISKCPFHGDGIPQKNPTGKGQTNKDWWPNSLNLKILSQHSSLVNPMDKKARFRTKCSSAHASALVRVPPTSVKWRLACCSRNVGTCEHLDHTGIHALRLATFGENL